VKNDVLKQEEHHRRQSFEGDLLEKAGIPHKVEDVFAA
jgi:hypothetical protein